MMPNEKLHTCVNMALPAHDNGHKFLTHCPPKLFTYVVLTEGVLKSQVELVITQDCLCAVAAILFVKYGNEKEVSLIQGSIDKFN